MTRAQQTEMILRALESTWKQQDETGVVRDAEHLQGILRGGCRQFLSGRFDPARDGVSLGLAFLSLAREALLDGGIADLISGEAVGQA